MTSEATGTVLTGYFLWITCVLFSIRRIEGMQSSFGCSSVELSCGEREFIHVKDAIYGHSQMSCSTIISHIQYYNNSCTVSLKRQMPTWFGEDVARHCNGRNTCQVFNRRRRIQCDGRFIPASFVEVTYDCLPIKNLGGLCNTFKTYNNIGYLESPGYTDDPTVSPVADELNKWWVTTCTCSLKTSGQFGIQITTIEEDFTTVPDSSTCDDVPSLIISGGIVHEQFNFCARSRESSHSVIINMTLSSDKVLNIEYRFSKMEKGRLLLKYEAVSRNGDAIEGVGSIDVGCGLYSEKKLYYDIIPTTDSSNISTAAVLRETISTEDNSWFIGGGIALLCLGLVLTVISVLMFYKAMGKKPMNQFRNSTKQRQNDDISDCGERDNIRNQMQEYALPVETALEVEDYLEPVPRYTKTHGNEPEPEYAYAYAIPSFFSTGKEVVTGSSLSTDNIQRPARVSYLEIID